MMKRNIALSTLLLTVISAAPVHAQERITSPKEQFGFEIVDDYMLATYAQFVEYWRNLDAESLRLIVVTICKYVEGRDPLMAIITSTANFEKIDRFLEISERLARARGLTDKQAGTFAKEGK